MKTNNIVINSIMKKYIKHLCAILVVLCTCIDALADTWTWTADVNDAEWFSGRTNGKAILHGKPWAFTRANGTSTTSNANYVQIGANGNPDDLVLYTNAIGGTITSIDVVCSSYGGYHSLKIEVGENIVMSPQATKSGTTVGSHSTGTISATGPIRITFTAGSAARYLYLQSITITYTPGTFNVDWFVGETKIKAETGVTSGTPPSIADGALGGECSTLKFLGWSERNLGGTPTSAPIDLFTSNEIPLLSGNTTYYAVFGEVATNTDDSVLIQILKYDTWTYSGTTADNSSYRLFAANAYVQSEVFDLSRLAKVAVGAAYYGNSSYGGFSIKDASIASYRFFRKRIIKWIAIV